MIECENMDAVKGENNRLRRALLLIASERKKMASQLTGVQNLGLQLQRKEQEVKSLSEKNERLEVSLTRAENRITQLSYIVRNNPQTLSMASQGAIVTPGVSKKVLEALTRENTKLKQALNHLTSKGPSGVDLAVENRELHEIIMTLKDEKDMKINELKELRKVISAVENQNIEALQSQVLSLSTQVTKLERNLNAKQVFCETIVTENEAMKNELQSLKDDRILKVRDVKKELGDLMKTTEMREIMQQVYENQEGEPEESASSEEVCKLKEEMQIVLEELRTTKQEKEHLLDKLNETLEELENSKGLIEIHQAQHQSREEELDRLQQQLQELEHNHRRLRRDSDEKGKELMDLQTEMELMRNTLGTYENDFKMERDEKINALREKDRAIQTFEQLRKEHFSLRQNIERMCSQAHAQQQAQSTYKRQPSGRPCGAQMQQPLQFAFPPKGLSPEVCVDGPVDDHADSPAMGAPVPTPRRYRGQGSQLQCPNCNKLFPHDLLENHMRDCTGDD
ncbi:myosin heavy chain, clone 203-like [Acropora millepora]|uniref:myosin heavy chain, clone 203-like n=1 Tax=Acropora millepora TaxID=45264 RepID=UPI001CF53241|nr:myosin heavy chain, clone 203-like [Acropora millepora]